MEKKLTQRSGRLLRKEDRTPSERRESARKAGKASGAARRQKRALRELLETALSMDAPDGGTNAEQIVASLIHAARDGDVKAFLAIRDTIGEKPVDKVQVGMADSLYEDILGVK